jgi:D-cysteine desulfhydrase
VMKTSHFIPPVWASHLKHVPKSRVRLLANDPTPVHQWSFSHAGTKLSLLIKRDDLSDTSASGNKIRKLEFLLAEALDSGADALVSVGGTGSNHCRAVAALAGRVGIEKVFLVLRKDRYFEGVQGNLLLNNVFGAHTYLVDATTYARDGQKKLTSNLRDRMVAEGRCSNV